MLEFHVLLINMSKEQLTSEGFRLGEINETRNYFLEEIKWLRTINFA